MVSSCEEKRMHLTLQELETKAMVSFQEEERMRLISGVKDHGDG
jgi:hypothetical protein